MEDGNPPEAATLQNAWHQQDMSVTLKLPDGSLHALPTEHFDSMVKISLPQLHLAGRHEVRVLYLNFFLFSLPACADDAF